MNILEKITRSNIYLYLISKYLYQNYLYKFFFEEEFKILKYSRFLKKKIIIDIGSNGGVSARSIRLFDKKNKIISFEPNKDLLNKLINTKKKIRNFQFYLYGGLNKNTKYHLNVPYFKNFCLDAQASVEKKLVLDSLQRGIFHKGILKKIYIKKSLCEFLRIDDFKLKPFFIKIDTEGSEHLVLDGLIKTINTHKPILMIEKNDINFTKIKKFMNKNNYNIYSYKNEKLKKYIYKKKEHLNLICIYKKNKNPYFNFPIK